MCRISVAYDEAFAFYYEDKLDLLRKAGADIVFFSPLHDDVLPECEGLYLGGGYPEVYAEKLSPNESMRKSICEAVKDGMPTVAECGGFMYLTTAIIDETGDEYPMAGVFEGICCPKKKAVRFGYAGAVAGKDSMLFKKGEVIPFHEFHHWDCDLCGDDLLAKKKDGRQWRFGYVGENLYAGFPHLHFGGEIPMGERFFEAAEKYSGRYTKKGI